MSRKKREHRSPSLEALRTLLIFSEAKGVSRTATRLGVTQPVVSRKLEIFEHEGTCGAVLLRRKQTFRRGQNQARERRSKELELTDAGKAVLPAIRELVRQYDQMLKHLGQKESAAEVVRLGSGSFAAQNYVPRLLAELKHQQAGWVLDTEVVRGRDRVLGTADGKFDLALVSHDPFQIENLVAVQRPGVELVIEPLARQTFCVLAAAGSEASAEFQRIPLGQSASLESLARWNLVGLDAHSGIRRALAEKMRARGLHPRYVEASGAGGWPAAKEYVRCGLGVAILPLAALIPEDAKSFTIRRLSKSFSVTDYLIHRSKQMTAAQLATKEILGSLGRRLEREIGERWRRI